MLDFYCGLYLKRFKVMPIRIEKTDRFMVGKGEKTVKEIKRELWPNLYKLMTESVKQRLKDASIMRQKIEERIKHKNGEMPAEEGMIEMIQPTCGTRADLIRLAKELNIKYFRVMNKAELIEAIAEGATQERIIEIGLKAKERWEKGWKGNGGDEAVS